MEYVEITLADGTVARWTIADPAVMDEVTEALEAILGPSETTAP